MNTQVIRPDHEPPNTIREVVLALKKEKLNPEHQAKNWGDWIHFPQTSNTTTVISIESHRGLTSQATIETDEENDDNLLPQILTAFRKLGWQGTDEDGPYSL